MTVRNKVTASSTNNSAAAISLDNQVVTVASSAINKLRKIEQELNAFFVERQPVIADLLRALSIGEHLFIAGPPGTGKSQLARECCRHIEGGHYFEWLLNKTTDPSALLGPYSIKAMERDRFIRKSTNMLPEAHVVFLDEIGKANEPVLNILLSILNERVFHNDGQAVPVPLRTLIAASNEMLDDDGISALYDRLLFRHQVARIKEPANRVKMLKMTVVQRANPANRRQQTTVTLAELDMLSAYINTVVISDIVYRTFEKLLRELELNHGITISDRRAVACMKVLQAEAALNGRDQVNQTDLRAIINVLWERAEDLAVLEEEVGKLVNPFEVELRKLKTRIAEIHQSVEGIEDRTEKTNRAIEAKVHYEKVLNKLNYLAMEAKKAGFDPADILETRSRVNRLNQEMLRECLGIGEPEDDDLQAPF